MTSRGMFFGASIPIRSATSLRSTMTCLREAAWIYATRGQPSSSHLAAIAAAS